MPFVSTRNSGGAAVPLATAVQHGLAPDGGLYVPVEIPALAPAEFAALRGASLPEVATALLAPLVAGTLTRAQLGDLMASALDFPVPLVSLGGGLSVLELVHGPTLAFKDIGARTMARFLAVVATGADPRPLTVLVATSGDTGGAVAHAFHGLAGTRVVVLYPRGRVSPVQEAQFATLGGNVTAVAVDGAFDDCQRLVKEAFADTALTEALRLTSANSINIGRLLPQMAYYAWAVLQLPAGAPPATVVVPSGNLGNLTAGVMAQRRGVPIGHFVAATTVNDPLPRFLTTGHYEPRASVPTLASAMDVGAPSNFERLSWLYGGDLGAMRTAMTGVAVTDADIRAALRELDARFGYLADPHTAVAYLGRDAAGPAAGPGAPTILLATAHAAKFREVVEPALGKSVPLPEALAERLALPLQVVPAAPTLTALTAVLAALD